MCVIVLLCRPNTPGTETGLTDLQLEFALLDWDRVTKNEVSGLSRKENSPYYTYDLYR